MASAVERAPRIGLQGPEPVGTHDPAPGAQIVLPGERQRSGTAAADPSGRKTGVSRLRPPAARGAKVEVSKGLKPLVGWGLGRGKAHPQPSRRAHGALPPLSPGFARAGRGAALAGAVAALLAGPAMAQTADWRSAAPVLPLQGPIRPFATPVTIGGAGWANWRRICREQTLRPGRPPQRDCLAVTAVQREAAGTRLTLVQENSGLRVSALRATDGRIAEFAALNPDGTMAPPDEARDGLLATWRAQFATLSLPARSLSGREDFPMRVEGQARGGSCRPEGLSTVAQRPVVVARCAVEMAGRLRGGDSEARIAIFARVAVDVGTGMVSAQGYATRIETFAANGRSNGVVVTPSRVVLE
jgi:hypothetical protein